MAIEEPSISETNEPTDILFYVDSLVSLIDGSSIATSCLLANIFYDQSLMIYLISLNRFPHWYGICIIMCD